MKKIVDAKLCFKWDDNKAEFMYENLPEYLYDEINTYLNELEELREVQGEEYSFTHDTSLNGRDSND